MLLQVSLTLLCPPLCPRRPLTHPKLPSLQPTDRRKPLGKSAIHRGALPCVRDFKTDAPSAEPAEVVFAEYAAQVRAYGRLLDQAGVARRECRYGLLFTADGSIRWLAVQY